MRRALFCLCALLTQVFGGEMSDRPVMIMETTQGNIEIELRPDVAPKACENMIKLAEKGYYDGVVFHRVIRDFMIQGGDPTATGMGGESAFGSPFEDEVSSQVKFEKKGLLAMANAGPKTNGSQFFITTKATPWLQGKHTIFGEVISGYETVEKIEGTPTGALDKPINAQVIKRMYLKGSAKESPEPAAKLNEEG